MLVVYPCGTVSVSSLGSFSSVGSSSKTIHSCLPFSLGVHHIQEYFKKNKRGGKQRYINPQYEKARNEEQRTQMRVTVQEKSVVGYWELFPMESGYENSSEQDTDTVTKDNQESEANLKSTLW